MVVSDQSSQHSLRIAFSPVLHRVELFGAKPWVKAEIRVKLGERRLLSGILRVEAVQHPRLTFRAGQSEHDGQGVRWYLLASLGETGGAFLRLLIHVAEEDHRVHSWLGQHGSQERKPTKRIVRVQM